MLVPIFIFALYQILLRSSHDFHNACLGLFCALVFTLAMTDAIKLTAGRYRPDWYARAGESESVIKDGRQSFPSGHSSISFAGMVFLSLYIAGKTGIFRKNGGAVWKAVVGFFPIIAAAAIAISRVRDYQYVSVFYCKLTISTLLIAITFLTSWLALSWALAWHSLLIC
jgi:diacylglycerol diphosphate phosphatase / phosphatidate phosphatase